MAAIRFVLPGAALYAWTRWQGHGPPDRAAWMRGAILGGLMLTIGNGAVTYGVTRMPSGLAALLVASVPMWAVAFEWMRGTRPRPIVVAGLLVGLVGVALLSRRDSSGWTGEFDIAFVLLILAGSASWAWGSLRSRAGAAPKSFWQDLALQMVLGGAFLGVLGAMTGEWQAVDLMAVSWTAWAGVLYLSVFGSVVALACFLWLLRSTTPAVATTYAFVNPAVAVAVGAWLGREPLTLAIVSASALIVGGVALIVAGKRAPREPAAAEPAKHEGSGPSMAESGKDA
jgi:drug/metabolite transporter (DMT)-like permease